MSLLTVTRHWKVPVSIAVAGIFVYWFVHKLNWLEVWDQVRDARWSYLGLAAALLIGTYLVRALRWQALLEPMVHTSVRSLLRATVIGFTALFVMGRAGEMIVRPAALSLKEPKVRPWASYATVMIERVFDMVAVVVIFAVNLVFFELAAKDDDSIHRFTLIQATGIFLLLVSAAGIFGLYIFRKKSSSVIAFIERKFKWLPRSAYEGMGSLLQHISDGLSVLHDMKSLGVIVSYTLLMWSMVVGGYAMVLRAFSINSDQAPLTGVVFVMGLSMIGSIIPSPAAATGPFHAAAAGALVFLGIERNRAASAAIILHLVIFLPVVFFGFAYLLKDGVSLTGLMGKGKSAPPADKPETSHLRQQISTGRSGREFATEQREPEVYEAVTDLPDHGRTVAGGASGG